MDPAQVERSRAALASARAALDRAALERARIERVLARSHRVRARALPVLRRAGLLR